MQRPYCCFLASPKPLQSFHFFSSAATPSPSTSIRRQIFAVSATAMTQPHPSLEVVSGGSDELFHPVLKSIERPYSPFPIFGWNRHVETIFAAFFRSLPEIRFRRQCLRTPDGGSVALDWVSGDDRRLPFDCPVLILLPGLTGGSDDTYVRHMLMRARSKGWRVVVFNSRGCGNSPVTTPQFYSASFTGDLRDVVAHVAALYPKSNLYGLGWSLGANILVRYLGEFHLDSNQQKITTPIQAAQTA